MKKPEEALPKPPEIPRRLVFNRTKRIGVPLLLAIPVLASFGVFGVSRGEVSAAAEGLELKLSYPERVRYRMSDHLDLTLTNTTARPLSRVTVLFDHAYVASFSEVHFTPAPRRITDDAYEIALDDIGPGETRRIHASLQANEYGRHRGTVTIAVDGAARSRLGVHTLTYP